MIRPFNSINLANSFVYVGDLVNHKSNIAGMHIMQGTDGISIIKNEYLVIRLSSEIVLAEFPPL